VTVLILWKFDFGLAIDVRMRVDFMRIVIYLGCLLMCESEQLIHEFVNYSDFKLSY